MRGFIIGSLLAGAALWDVIAFVSWDAYWITNVPEWDDVERFLLLLFGGCWIVAGGLIGADLIK